MSYACEGLANAPKAMAGGLGQRLSSRSGPGVAACRVEAKRTAACGHERCENELRINGESD